ncbi:HipA domain-containing protein [Noviherbaspirillum pedocola]|uniref:HipA domain-containing protein n=1 Tax=Noviherbaspirillum pedocola TaxID=2801341 RepID=A0A934W5K7_9BURK|nr:HipA domain-containing protein [Noviherbaspirillum pedocola]MBK4735072.1 HipA domain-containing protein [Noviherbaspirillum pedocola]
MKLVVWVQGQRVGLLSYDGALSRFAFDYEPDWIGRRGAFALGPTLPLTSDPNQNADQHSAVVRQFFQNLLPEGKALDDAAGANKVSRTSVMGLLHVLGRETAGALMFTLPDEDPHQLGQPSRPLTDGELSQRIRARPQMPFSVWDGKVRLSIAGYQDKLAVYEKDGQWFLVEDPRLASTLILKPEPIADFMAGMTTNEFLCMRLAASLRLPVAKVYLKQVPEPVLLIERFDRKLMPTADGAIFVRRIHCIDGCQALGLPVDFKYERPYGDGVEVQNVRDGASLKRFLTLLDDKTITLAPGVSKLQFLRWTIFQILIGNTDAHAKNMSFFCEGGGLSIAPAYDLVCALAHAGDQLQTTLAMAVGDNFDPLKISAYDWAQMAHENALVPRLVASELRRMGKACLDALPGLVRELESEGAERGMLLRVQDVVARQAAEAMRVAPLISKVDQALF